MGIISVRARGLGRLAWVVAALGLMGVALGQVQEEWVARYNGAASIDDRAHRLVLDSAGNVYLTGYTDDGVSGSNSVTLKYDPDGNLLWEQRYLGLGSRYAMAFGLAVDAAGNVFVAVLNDTNVSNLDYATLKYDPNGNLLWERLYEGPDNAFDQPLALALDDDGNVLVTGREWNFDPLAFRGIRTIKYDTDGNQLWIRGYEGPSADGDGEVPFDIAADSSGNVYVTGYSPGVGTGMDGVTLKYDTSGNLLWAQHYNGPGNDFDWCYRLAPDSAGNVYVTGRSTGVGTGLDYATLKYDADGNLLWERRYNGPGNSVDTASAIVVVGAGNAGNVYVTGRSTGAGTGEDYATLKYDTDGNLLWERRYNGPGGGDDWGRGLAVDGAGNVYVTGRSVGAGTGEDYATLKYDADGNLLWEMRYNGPGNGLDRSFHLAVEFDGAGNVYVSGDSEGSGPGFDIATIKYSQSIFVGPHSVSIQRGFLTAGGLSELLASDDARLDVRAGLTLFLGESPLQVAVTGTSPVESPTELRFKLEAGANTPGLTQTIELFNYDTSSYEQVDLSIPGPTDGIVEVVVTTNPGRFVQAGTREMRAKVSYVQVGLTLLWPWSAKLDQAVWTIVP